jgi:hypothetical protein
MIQTARPPSGTQEWAASNVNILPFNCPRNAEAVRRSEALVALQSDTAIRALYQRHRHDPMIKWKDSIKTVVGLNRPAAAGLDE